MKMGASNMDDNNEVIAMLDGPNQVQMKMGASNVYIPRRCLMRFIAMIVCVSHR